MKTIELLPPDVLKQKAPQLDYGSFEKIVNYINLQLNNRQVPYYIYIFPDLEKISGEIGIQGKSMYLTLNFLAGFYSKKVKHEIIFDFGNKIYKLQEPDLEELKSSKKFYNPDNPKEVFEKADELVRRAFVFEVG